MSTSELMMRCLAGCTQPQREAIEHLQGPLLVLAGPGSGKTRVITRRIGYLIASGVRPDDVLAITFTNKAANEMRERVEALGVPRGAWISTFHSFCARMLRVYANFVGLKPNFTIYDTDDSLRAIRRAMETLDITPAELQPSYAARLISDAKNRLQGPEGVRTPGAPEEAARVAQIFQQYDKLLRSANAVDFDDLLVLMARLLLDTPDLQETLSRRFRHVLVDEYQDTNHAQYVIARQLAAGHGNICVTGDPDQSIYGWRGADISNILEFERDYPQAKVVRLEQNYRSTKRILRAADYLISHNLARKRKSLWTENPEGPPVRVFRFEDEQQEAEAVAEEIANLINTGHAVPKDFAIFYRVNAQSRQLEAALRDRGIPYTIVAGTEFYQRREIKDLLAYLRLIDNPADDVSAERVANVPQRRIGGSSIQRAKEWAAQRKLPLLEGVAHAAEAGIKGPALQGAADFLRVLAELRAMPRCPAAKVVQRLLELTDFETHLSQTTENSAERIENVRELVNAAAEYDRAEPEGGISGFLEQAALVSDTDRWDETRGGVTLMTLHAAKGLEFPIVYIVGLEDGLLPLKRNDGGHDLEEERRLFFVGLTRAKHRAAVTYAESRARYGERGYSEPSCFLSELPDDVVAESPRTPRAGRGAFAFGYDVRRPRPALECRRVRRSDNEEIVYDGEHAPCSEADAALPAAPFRPGDAVTHPTYGRGKVLELSGYGDELRATVQFPSVGVKRLVLKFAKLRKA